MGTAMHEVYEPAEDSFLLAKAVKKFACGRVLDIGVGAGVQAEACLKNKRVTSVVGVDINPQALVYCKKHITDARASFLQSDMFSVVHGVFDTVVCNPPYLPQDKGIEDPALYGGKKGWEFIERLLSEAKVFLTAQGKILLLFSSLTNKKKVDALVGKYLFVKKEIARQHVGFEDLFVYELRKSAVAKKFERIGVVNAVVFARGKRGVIHVGRLGKRKVAVKTKLPSSEARGRIAHEARMLVVVNRQGIGPKKVAYRNDCLVYEFVEGTLWKDFFPSATGEDVVRVLREVLHQCLILDKLGVSKEEMHRPLKHIIVGKDSVVLVDFERCCTRLQPQNVTQLCEFIRRIAPDLERKSVHVDVDHLLIAARAYKESRSDTAAKEIASYFGAYR